MLTTFRYFYLYLSFEVLKRLELQAIPRPSGGHNSQGSTRRYHIKYQKYHLARVGALFIRASLRERTKYVPRPHATIRRLDDQAAVHAVSCCVPACNECSTFCILSSLTGATVDCHSLRHRLSHNAACWPCHILVTRPALSLTPLIIHSLGQCHWRRLAM